MNMKIGFIGLGEMGKWMSFNMVKAGYDVTVCDINPAAVEFLTGKGAKSSRHPAELAGTVDLIFLSLPDTDVVETVIFGENGIILGAKPGLTVVDLSTISYLPTLEIDRKLKEKGIAFADAPVSGMESRAREGALTIMFGGDPAALETLRPVLEVIGTKIVYMGKVGSGQLTKLINQLLFNICCAGVAEVMPMAAKLGLDPERVTEVVTTGTGRSFAAEFFLPLALENRFDQGYALKHAYKDMVSAAELSARRKIPLPVVQATTATFQMALLQGLGDENKGALIKVFERMLGVEFRKQKGSS
ncbi:MAG: NAD(P)-dependent oxidoreductase [Thermodesulfobacteriota bacterium]